MQKFIVRFPNSQFSANHLTSSGVLRVEDLNLVDKQIQYIRDQGYKVSLDKDIQSREKSKKLVELTVAFVCFMNVMIFACCEYFADEGEISILFLQFFRWSSAVLCSVSLFYCAKSILWGGFFSLKKKSPSVDLSISFALLCAYLFSLYSLYQIGLSPFFDSITATVFFILVGRFFQNRFLMKKNAELLDLQKGISHFVTRMDSNSTQIIDTGLVQIGDKLRVFPGEIVPVSSQLQNERARFSLDLITGESNPIQIEHGALVPAGAVCLGEPVIVVAQESGQDSNLKKIQRQSFELTLQKMGLASTSDKLANTFYFLVVIAAASCFFVSLPLGWNESISRTVAVLLVACPCAFAVALPLGTLRCAFEASKLGIIFKNAKAIQNMSNCRQAIFDKTGTLSKQKLNITAMQSDESFYSELSHLVYSACSQSVHPTAIALKNYLGKKFLIREPLSGIVVKEVFGKGLKFFWGAKWYYLGSQSFCKIKDPKSFDLFLCQDDFKIIAQFKVEESPADGLNECVSTLKDLGFKLIILSGDSKKKVASFALGHGFEHYVADSSPKEKQDFLTHQPPSIMVGNGFNDSLALSKSHTGISVAESNATAFEYSDVHLTQSSLVAIGQAVKLSKCSMRHMYQAFGFAVIYNTCTISLAFWGLLTPVVASILMPINGMVVSIIAAREIRL